MYRKNTSRNASEITDPIKIPSTSPERVLTLVKQQLRVPALRGVAEADSTSRDIELIAGILQHRNRRLRHTQHNTHI
jgi:hypothetical protein